MIKLKRGYHLVISLFCAPCMANNLTMQVRYGGM